MPGVVPVIRDTEDRRVLAFKGHETKVKETEPTGDSLSQKKKYMYIYIHCVHMRERERDFKESARMIMEAGEPQICRTGWREPQGGADVVG